MKENSSPLPHSSSEDATRGRLNLRGKLTVANMAITFLVVFIMGLYLYLRIQDSSTQLTSRLEENIRVRAQADLLNSVREQSILLDTFFENMSKNTTVVGTSITNILTEQVNLKDSTYWNPAISLRQLEGGSWDNLNTEPSSVFLPADVDLTPSLLEELKVLKHSDLIIPSILSDNPDIVAIYFGGTSKETIYYPNIDLANIVPADFDVTGRVWYLDALPDNNPNNEVIWSAPYEDAALNGLVITTSTPVYDSHNRFQGVAAMDIQLNRITNLISNIKIGETGYAFLVDNEKRLFSLPGQGYVDFGITDENAQLSDIMDSAALTSATPEFYQILDTISQGQGASFNITLAGTERFVVYQTIPQVQYKLVMIVPASELLTDTALIAEEIQKQTRNTILFSLVIILVVFALAAVTSLGISNRLTAPLQTLNQVANEIIRGNYSVKSNIHSQDELETFGDTLDTMTDTIRDLVTSLEQRVEERTFELQKELQHGEKRAKEYEAVTKVAQAINTRQNLQELLPLITEVISEQFGFYHVGIFLTDASNRFAVLSAANSEGGMNMLNRGHQLRVGIQGIVGYVTGSGKPRIARNVGDDAAYFNNPDLPRTHSEMALPLTLSGKIIGALDVQSENTNAFTDEDVDVLTILADLVSIAIQNARLYEQMQRSLVEAESATRQYFKENWTRLSEEYKISGYRYTSSGAIPIFEGSNGSDPEEMEARRNYTVPIVIRGQMVGELSVSVPKQEPIKSDQMDLVRAVAERVGIFAENARLFDETTRRAERERLVSDITNKIRSTNDPKEMIQTAIQELRQALNVSRIEIIPQKPSQPDKE
ncbi:MAG TPA: cache domain-containing protein [Anaerolineales bacterium]|nr:cache domain-containing protein [Anaerolineales bacterium]HNC07348.1 cache domain-containing protein [Anaerolineales bacterium]